MFSPGEAFWGTRQSARRWTTLLAGGWGFAFSYSFFRCLFSAECPRYCTIALIPLIAVWATLERKRWGRLALLGLSRTMLGLFVVSIGLMLADSSFLPSVTSLHVADIIPQALGFYTNYPRATLMILLLAVASSLWFCLPVVKAEFEQGKQSFLSTGQRAIAFSLVLLWGLTVLFAPPVSTAKSGLNTPARTSQ